MKRLLTLTTVIALVAGIGPALAQSNTFVPGEDFMAQWDVNGDGKVTLAEAREHRGDIFSMFDSDDNGSFSADELKGIDEHKLMELEAGMGPGHNLPEGMQPRQGMGPGQGQGRGPGQGMGQGMGQGPGQGMRQSQMGQGQMGQGQMGQGQMAQGQMMGQGLTQSAEDGMKMFDANRDGTVTREEFVNGTDAWFAMRDSNGDGVLTVDDFGPRR